jgi:transcriptional regulator with XRE-family HTH domain
MTTTRLQAAADRRSAAARRDLAEQLRRLMQDAGVHQRELALAAGIARSYLGRILRADADPSLETYARLGAVLGADLSARYFPTTGPAIRDRHQAPMLELLLATTRPRWRPFTEVGVRRPNRGWIDAALHDPDEHVLVASELQSELRRLEQLVRWHAAKAEALPSWDGWAQLGEEPAISRLLVVRRTRATRGIATEFGRQLRAAHPAHPDDAITALAGNDAWPGAALLWVVMDVRGTRFAPGR